MILDHPLRKAFTIEIAAGLAVAQGDETEFLSLFQEFTSIFKQAYFEGEITPYIKPSCPDVNNILFCRKSLSLILERL
jgi:hypothetical protein